MQKNINPSKIKNANSLEFSAVDESPPDAIVPKNQRPRQTTQRGRSVHQKSKKIQVPVRSRSSRVPTSNACIREKKLLLKKCVNVQNVVLYTQKVLADTSS